MRPFVAAFIHSTLDANQAQEGSATELNWIYLQKLKSADMLQLVTWLVEKVQVLSSGHAESQLQMNPLPEVHFLLFIYHHH